MSDFMQGNPDSAVQVPFSDDEAEAVATKDEELVEEDSPLASPEERISRNKKRSERIKRLLDEGKQNGEKVRNLESEQNALKQELAELRGRLSERAAAPPPQADGKDYYEKQLDAVYEKQNDAYMAAQAEIKAGTFTAERQKHYEGVARWVESEKTRIHTERVIDSREPARRAEQAQQGWVQKYPEVYGNPKAYQFAEATFRRRLALGEQQSNELVHEVMAEAINTFRLGPKKAPTASDRSRMSGVPSSGSGGGGGRDPSGITMTPELKRMAVAAYSELSEADAIKKWVNGPGKRLREKKVI